MKGNKILVIVLISIFLLAILGGAGFYLFTKQSALQSVTGTSTLSLSQVDLQSNNPQLNGKAWMLTFTSSGLGQSYYGTITPSDVQSKTSDDTTTTNNLNIGVTYGDTQCSYPITSQADYSKYPIYKNLKIQYYVSYDCSFSNAQSKFPTALYSWGDTIPFKCDVITYDSVAYVSTLTSPNVGLSYTITLSVNGNTATKTINTLDGSTSGAIGNYAYGVWNGNLVSGLSCDSATNFNHNNYLAMSNNNQWTLISSQAYQDYRSSFISMDTNIVKNNQEFKSSIQGKLDTLNSYANTAMVSKSTSNPYSLVNGKLVFTTSTPVQFPVTTLYVKADTLGIYTPTPNIQITSASSNCFSNGNQGIIAVGLSNSGETGTFTAYAICDSPFSFTNNYQGSLNKGESTTINLVISGSAQQKTNGNCIVHVDTTGSSKTKSVGVCVNPLKECLIDYPTKFCGISNGVQVVQQCSQDGSTTNILQSCTSTQTCVKGECQEGGGGGGGGFLDWLTSIWNSISNFFTSFKWIVAIVLGILSGLFSWLFTSDILNKKGITGKWWIGLIVGLVIGLAVGAIAFIYFWIGIIIAVILIVIKIII